ncbi:MAG: putative molybdenum carrier protein [Candidatus Riflebacteria bacterium]|nr:putative molybdenum carrier protein [Candidatus Riflebacteria bacterium]
MSSKQKKYALAMLISGGQTGVDRAALDFAMQIGISHAGWCPLGRKAEDGVIPERYLLREATKPLYQQRTQLNVRDSQATLIIQDTTRRSRGTALTIKCSEKLHRPFMVVDITNYDSEEIRNWLARVRPQILNVAGPRLSESHDAAVAAAAILTAILCVDDSSAVRWPPTKPFTRNLF